ncbi:uncharacterized protein LOC128225693 [Mya arenaria]|uniref:uncharacterized protein LOC128225693 n=1 Tax=Mya arenaria TaxID=6604 RepID=UPI0022DEC395|nr:uncharacterized protein LOC128225693 [Mya arenaria]
MKRSSKRKRTSTTSACSCCANLTVQPTPASTPPTKHSLETAAATTSKGPSTVQTPAKRSRKRPSLLPLPNEDSADRHAPHNLQNRSCVNLPLEDSADSQDLDIHNVIPDHAPFPPTPLPTQPQASSFPASVHPPNHSRPAPFSAQAIIDDDTSDDDFQDVSQAVQYHGHNILPGNGIHYAEPISTPISHQVKKSIQHDIWRNKFIDLASLLPSLSSSSQTPVQYTLNLDQHSNISVQASSRLRKITSIDTWTTAFLRFVAIYTAKFPFETPQLMKYGEIVRDLAARRPGLAFAQYDTQFRMLRESVLLPWDRLHTEFLLMASTSYHPPTQSFRSHQQANTSCPSCPRRFHPNTCWNFNRSTKCRSQHCPHPHICGYCLGPHPAYNCKFTNKEQAGRTPPAKPSANPLPPK